MLFLIDLLNTIAVLHIIIQKDGHGGKERTGVIDGGNRRMKLIIDIPEELYNGIECRNPELETEYVCHELMKAVDNGTPLDDVKAEITKIPTHNMLKAYEVKPKVFQILDNIGKAESEDEE